MRGSPGVVAPGDEAGEPPDEAVSMRSGAYSADSSSWVRAAVTRSAMISSASSSERTSGLAMARSLSEKPG